MKVRWAVMGCGKIVARFVKGLRLCKNAELIGFAASDPDRAREYAERFGAPLYGDYDRIMNDPEVDAVYISTYNAGHYELVSSALKHGKHVLCEKPMVATKKQTRELFELARSKGVLLMEACKGPFMPINKEIRRMIADGVFGDVLYVHAAYSYDGHFPADHWIYDGVYGGSLMDVGSYPVSVLNYVLNRSPKLVDRQKTMYRGTDGFAQALISYGNGIQGHIHTGIILPTDRHMEIYGRKGHLISDLFWRNGSCRYWIGDEEFELNCEMKDDFFYEINHFVGCVLGGLTESPVMSEQASLDLLEIIGNEE